MFKTLRHMLLRIKTARHEFSVYYFKLSTRFES